MVTTGTLQCSVCGQRTRKAWLQWWGFNVLCGYCAYWATGKHRITLALPHR